MSSIIIPIPTRAITSKFSYQVFYCPICEKRNKQSLNAATAKNEETGIYTFTCNGCYRLIPVTPHKHSLIVLL